MIPTRGADLTTTKIRPTFFGEPVSVRPDSIPSDLIASRMKILTAVAERYHELTETQSPGGSSGTGSLVALTPHERHCLLLTTLGRGARCTCAYRTVREFERLLGVMREGRHSLVLVAGEKHSVRALRWHLVGWYVDARRVVRHFPKRPVKGQRLAVPVGQEILRDGSGAFVPSIVREDWQRTAGARKELADVGLRWVAVAWPDRFGEPMLPLDIRAAA